MDQLRLIQPTTIDSHSTCKLLHRCSVPCYCSAYQNETLKEYETDRSGKFSCLILA